MAARTCHLPLRGIDRHDLGQGEAHRHRPRPGGTTPTTSGATPPGTAVSRERQAPALRRRDHGATLRAANLVEEQVVRSEDSSSNPTGLLVVGHGSRSVEARGQMLQIGAMVAEAAPEVAVEVGFLELSDPSAGQALDQLVRRGVRRASVVPLMLNPAGHAKSDVPAVVLDGRRRHRGVTLAYARPLGADLRLVSLAAHRLDQAGARGLPLVVLARGTSDPDANGDAYKVARLLAEANASRVVEVGFSGITWPSVPEALALLRRKADGPLATVAWFLCTGVLIERMRDQIAEFSSGTGTAVVDAGYLGPDPVLVPLVLDRHLEALHGDIRMNCDTCAYRHPFPGLEDRVGQAVGVGHSHLAAEHRGTGSGHEHHLS